MVIDMFGTNQQFNLERLPFTAAGAFLSIYQDLNDKQLYLNVCRGKSAILDRPNLIRIALTQEGALLPFIYSCTASRLTLSSAQGMVEFTYEADPSVMRVRSTGPALDFQFRFDPSESGCVLPSGDVELCFQRIGKIGFSCISGTMSENLSDEPCRIQIKPEPESKVAELAITEYDSVCVRNAPYAAFDTVAAEKQAEFDRFCENYGSVPLPYKAMAEKAMYMVWHSYLGPRGSLYEPLVYMHKLYMNRAFGWQQVFHAIAMKKNTREAWRLLLAFFDYQNDIGGIPDHVSDLGQVTFLTTKPPIQGYGVVQILDGFDLSALTASDYQCMYDKLSRYVDWWFTYHDHARTGYPAFYHPDESGYDESTAYNRGLPVISPDLLAYTVFNCEACARLAGRLGDGEKEEYWFRRAHYVLDYLIQTLWDGEQFLEYLPREKTFYKCGSIVQLQPIMLGKRLPEEIRSTLVKRLTDPEEYMTDYGVASEHLKSDKVVMRAFTRGAVIAPTELFLIKGMRDAGYETEARELCVRYLNALLHQGLALGIHPYRVEPALGNEIAREASAMSVGHPFSSWVGSVFLLLAEDLALEDSLCD